MGFSNSFPEFLLSLFINQTPDTIFETPDGTNGISDATNGTWDEAFETSDAINQASDRTNDAWDGVNQASDEANEASNASSDASDGTNEASDAINQAWFMTNDAWDEANQASDTAGKSQKVVKTRFLPDLARQMGKTRQFWCAMGERWRATAVQDAGALADGERTARSVLECASPLALWTSATAKTATGTGALPSNVPVGGRVQTPANGSLGWTNGAKDV